MARVGGLRRALAQCLRQLPAAEQAATSSSRAAQAAIAWPDCQPSTSYSAPDPPAWQRHWRRAAASSAAAAAARLLRLLPPLQHRFEACVLRQVLCYAALIQ